MIGVSSQSMSSQVANGWWTTTFGSGSSTSVGASEDCRTSWTPTGSDEGCSGTSGIDRSANGSSTLDSSWSEVDRFLRLAASNIVSSREGRGVMATRALGCVDGGVCGVR